MSDESINLINGIESDTAEKTDEDWADTYGMVPPDPSDPGVWNYKHLDDAKIAAGGNERRIWTIVQGDGSDGRDSQNMYRLAWICPGARFVNRLDYLVSEREWTEDTPEYIWFSDGG